MNCKQLEKQISEQVGIIKKLRADVNQFNGVLEVAKAKLEGAFTESAENSANAAKTADCDSWQILILKGEMQVCTEPTNGKPPKCHFRPLKPNERNIKNKCDVSTANAKNIHDSRENLKQAESNAKAFLASAQTKINVAVANLNKLREAKDGKLECY
jgi:hypothetical protein